ncbi:MAG: chorismate lyase [Burkholderiales bacterium]|nr:chorismate lyase [Burkholderiales bacterium]
MSAPGSLTARLRVHGHVEVRVHSQGSQGLWPSEQRDLACRSGHVREVMLLLDGVPAVWARSTTTHQALRGPWKALTGLGTRPLAELLFQGRHVCRDPIRIHPLPAHGQQHAHLRQQWLAQCPELAMPRWARSSVFWRQGQPVRVMEAFAPWMTHLDAHRLVRQGLIRG